MCSFLYEKNQQIKRVKTDLESVIQNVQPGYLKRGLRWRIPEDSYNWIELIKEYHKNEQSLHDHNSKIQESDEIKSQ